MGYDSSIEWTDHTFNPWIGCAKVSAGCKHCYAETLMDTRWGRVEWGVNGTRVRTSDATWRKPLAWNREAAAQGVRYRVFCASLADVFEDRPELTAWRADLLDLIAQTPSLDWLLLTKRPENVLRLVDEAHRSVGMAKAGRFYQLCGMWTSGFAPANVWLGTSVEDHAAAVERIPHLLQCPAQIRFLSMEPLLGPVDFYQVSGAWPSGPDHPWRNTPILHGIDWVIAGGESGHGARPMHPDWVRLVRDQCLSAGVAFHFKQWGNYTPIWPGTEGWSVMHDFGDDVRAFNVGKKSAGRILDGRTWDEYPQAVPA